MKEGENNDHEETNKTRWSKWIEDKKRKEKKTKKKEQCMYPSNSHRPKDTVTTYEIQLQVDGKRISNVR